MLGPIPPPPPIDERRRRLHPKRLSWIGSTWVIETELVFRTPRWVGRARGGCTPAAYRRLAHASASNLVTA